MSQSETSNPAVYTVTVVSDSDSPPTNEAYSRFESLTRRLVAVPKSDIEAERNA